HQELSPANRAGGKWADDQQQYRGERTIPHKLVEHDLSAAQDRLESASSGGRNLHIDSSPRAEQPPGHVQRTLWRGELDWHCHMEGSSEAGEYRRSEVSAAG